MPSQPNANSPYLTSRLQADMGVRAPGSPTSAGKPGVQAADLSFPAPPALASGPSGRPPAARIPTPTPGPAQPRQPQQQSGTQPPAQGAAPATGAAAGAQAAPVVPAPLGTPAGMDATGAPQFALTPDGDLRYRQAVLAKRAELGPMPRVFRSPGLPEMPLELGHFNYNPFTGAWVK